MLSVDLEFLLQEHWLQTVNTHKDKGQHEIVREAADEVLGGDARVQFYFFEASGLRLFFEEQRRVLHEIIIN